MTTEKTGSLVVRIHQPASETTASIPVEVRDLKHLVVRARGFADQEISLSPGSYLVTATLPDGEQAAAENAVEITGGLTEITLSSLSAGLEQDIGEQPPMAFDSTASYTPPPALVIPVSRHARGKSEATLDCSLIKGPWLDYWLRKSSSPLLSQTPLPAENRTLSIARQDQPCLLQLTHGKRIRHFAIPVDHSGETKVTLRQETDGRPAITLDFGRQDVNAFFRYVDLGFAPEARFLSKQIVEEAQSFLSGNSESSLGGILGGYVLLRANEIDFMRRWISRHKTDNLNWLPDVKAIHIEFLAREGKHAQAVEELLKLPDWGAPWFRSGIAYLAERARTYVSLAQQERSRSKAEGNQSERNIPGLDLKLSREVFSKLIRLDATLSRLASALDLKSTTSVYCGLHPSFS